MATKRRRFTAESKHGWQWRRCAATARSRRSRPSTRCTRTRCLWEVFAGGANRRQADQETVIHDLHAKIGELTVERDFLSRGLGR